MQAQMAGRISMEREMRRCSMVSHASTQPSSRSSRVSDESSRPTSIGTGTAFPPRDEAQASAFRHMPKGMCILSCLVIFLAAAGDAADQVLALVGSVMLLCCAAGLYVWWQAHGSVTGPVFTVAAVALGVSVAVLDVAMASQELPRAWPLALVLLTVLHTANAPPRITAWFAVGIVGWLVVTSAEAVARFGLYDMPGLSGSEYRIKELCGCDAPPCRRLGGWVECIFGALVVAANAKALEVVHARVEEERTNMQSAVSIANRVADHLVGFDLDAAQSELEESVGALPLGLHAALNELLANLREYRPYLPQTILGGRRATSHGTECSPPTVQPTCPPPALGQKEPACSIMFTDVRASTVIWRQRPAAMQEALRLHNIEVRECITNRQGYEVKTIGDAFMVAFEAPERAVRCGLDIQKRLIDVSWPEELLEVPQCAADPDGLWGGLALRIAVDHGPIVVEANMITGRYDYFGDVVNRAARLEGVCPPGGVAALDEIMKAVEEQVGEACVCMQTYEAVLRGFEDDDDNYVDVRAVTPAALCGRGKLSHEEWTQRVVHGHEADQGSLSPNGRRSSSVSELLINPGFTPMQTEERQATLGAVLVNVPAGLELSGVSEYLHAFFPRLLHCLSITSGSVFTTVHDLVVLSWGAGTPTPSHQEAAINFVRLFREVRMGDLAATSPTSSPTALGGSVLGQSVLGQSMLGQQRTQRDFHVALACSSVCVGDVGGATQRFVTIFGAAVPLVLKTVRLAGRMGMVGLYASHILPPTELKQLRERVLLIGIYLQYVQEITFPWLDDAAAKIQLFDMRSRSDANFDEDSSAPGLSRHGTASISFFGCAGFRQSKASSSSTTLSRSRIASCQTAATTGTAITDTTVTLGPGLASPSSQSSISMHSRLSAMHQARRATPPGPLPKASSSPV
eukprot:TRINITY_DN25013_c0_g1_i1.p1 TRINITY_DN25013_c0_g1~~TRINITY_DN25013_c0_g1_i1.p1  ORF type:complete len:915 (+),score=184.04 TRINITY_DN25013_c0_g1_i1:107-2851(+)